MVGQLVALLRENGPDTPVDVDNVGQREALDVSLTAHPPLSSVALNCFLDTPV